MKMMCICGVYNSVVCLNDMKLTSVKHKTDRSD